MSVVLTKTHPLSLFRLLSSIKMKHLVLYYIFNAKGPISICYSWKQEADVPAFIMNFLSAWFGKQILSKEKTQ